MDPTLFFLIVVGLEVWSMIRYVEYDDLIPDGGSIMRAHGLDCRYK